MVSILNNEGAVLNVSTLLNNYNGVSDVFLGAPCVVDRSGVREVLDLPLSEDEKAMFQKSAEKLKAEISKLEL
ncbi:L-lactate dehydrogenase P [compost metagenome]